MSPDYKFDCRSANRASLSADGRLALNAPDAGAPTSSRSPTRNTELKLAYALRFDGGRRTDKAAEIVSEMAASGLVEDLDCTDFVAIKRRSVCRGAALGRGFEG